jgi:hypothetical protein
MGQAQPVNSTGGGTRSKLYRSMPVATPGGGHAAVPLVPWGARWDRSPFVQPSRSGQGNGLSKHGAGSLCE